ncbi:hypothetical protein [Streptococcus halichoeri]|uniref:hypothetical protein n=1 Tax=Streptococcus halichoeri TaxID=254785 RepID=UPI00135747BD|nr:hypothetical protein [Streptococcus halichoeri]
MGKEELLLPNTVLLFLKALSQRMPFAWSGFLMIYCDRRYRLGKIDFEMARFIWMLGLIFLKAVSVLSTFFFCPYKS